MALTPTQTAELHGKLNEMHDAIEARTNKDYIRLLGLCSMSRLLQVEVHSVHNAAGLARLHEMLVEFCATALGHEVRHYGEKHGVEVETVVEALKTDCKMLEDVIGL